MRTGIGFDIHPFADDRELWLGCVRVPSERGLAGHSDADVVAHAIADALLGAAALGDIGTHFPPGDARWAGVGGATILEGVAGLVRDAGYRISNVDAMAIIEQPKIAPHREAMRDAIAEALGVPAARVSVKATTSDGLGFVGRGEGAGCLATALIEPVGSQTLG